ncbi:MAG TPA: hypothetical protein VNX68_12740 [Nitrosopumilaceae archaeon]|jgi:hypothetical protein|nr:hypothetical protein [Nitrosopumilaceae archaeon]
MAFNFPGLASYVDQLSQPLISRAVLEARTAQFIDVIQGVKYAEQINILDINPFVVMANNQSNQGFIDSGTTIISGITAVACPLKIQNSFVLEGIGGLEQIWYGMLLKSGSYTESAPAFEEAFMSQLQKYTSQAVDYVLWLGGYIPGGSNAHSADTSGGGAGYLGGCVGILNQLYNTAASASTTTVTYSGAPTQATIYAIIEGIVAAIPSNMLMLPNISIWCQPAYIDMYKRALFALNNNTGNYWINPAFSSQATSDLDIQIPGRSNITLRGTPGLAGSSGAGFQGFVCSNDNNLALITDLMNDYERTQVWFSNDFDQLRATTKFKAGGIAKITAQVIVY